MLDNINAVKKNLDKATFVAKNGGKVNMLHFCRLEEDAPAVCMVGETDILIPAIASLVHNLATNLEGGKQSAKADEAMLLTVREALNDIYWRN